MLRHALLAIVGIALALPASAAGQGGGVELGAGLGTLGVAYGSGPAYVYGRFSEATVMATFYTSDFFGIEPRLSGNFYYGQGEYRGTLNADIGTPIHFMPTRGRSGWYLRPTVGFTVVDANHHSPEVGRWNAGVGLGVKVPVEQRMALRIEATTRHAFDADQAVVTSLLVGMSFFTR